MHNNDYKTLPPKDRIERYEKAHAKAVLWYGKLQIAYQLTMPTRAEFTIKYKTPGTALYNHVYNSTPVRALSHYASNLSSLLCPKGSNWAKLTPSRHTEELAQQGKIDLHEAREQLSKVEDQLFEAIDKSNFHQATHQAMMEMAISTGVMLIQAGPSIEEPVRYTAVPLHEICCEPGPDGSIQNVYRYYKLQARIIQQQWPEAQLPNSVMDALADDPTKEIELIEGTMFHPELPKEHQWCYFVMDKAAAEDIYIDYRDFSPWVVARTGVLPGETFGHGPVLQSLSDIKLLNKMSQDLIRYNSYQAGPMWGDSTGSSINFYTANLEPGAVIPVAAGPNGQSTLFQIPVTGNVTWNAQQIQQLEESIQEALQVNPLQAEDPKGDRTAYEIQQKQLEWQRQNQALEARSEKEWLWPILDKTYRIMAKWGYWKSYKLDQSMVNVEFQSPLRQMRGKTEISNLMQSVQQLAEVVGPELAQQMLVYNYQVDKLGQFIAFNNNVDPDLIRSDLEKSKITQMASQVAQQAPQTAPVQPTQGAPINAGQTPAG